MTKVPDSDEVFKLENTRYRIFFLRKNYMLKSTAEYDELSRESGCDLYLIDTDSLTPTQKLNLNKEMKKGYLSDIEMLSYKKETLQYCEKPK